ncbi:alanine or glycine:cation symporter, AGCS family [Moraxella cuniculi DSM 21768]|uniref:Alanine or glycine:cation symporter, AGCS family n=1 Tax=Moraxella cuniculi DSM 21768 TaxID=1122245 RepID=A0A1N7FZ33_9GAMM|nr:alanine/glycine:cation symporter family protein [Moraxella cuniculi]OOS04199.1 sodium:alanine symporter family protein [Moraxella cuniculi]SIS05504.1 alanine or glycine:cation symporter, AGCS family [Moraxella cuniculi DSM 21768]
MYNNPLSCFNQPDFVNGLDCAVQAVSTPLWDILIWLLIGIGLFFTIFSGLAQFRLFGRSIKSMLGSRKHDGEGISGFQAFVTGLASRVGVGNVAGVAIAISIGGAGAVFWMWLIALIGMCSALAESSLAQLFKVRDKATGQFRGGPAYYIEQGLGQKWLGLLFALSLIVCFGFVYQAIQSNTITLAIASASGCMTDTPECQSDWQIYKHVVGAILVVLTAPIIFGGIKRVARIAEIIVPAMALVYLLVAVVIIAMNITALPTVIALIFQKAFVFEAAGGGLFGSMVSIAMMQGIKRGLYSNEAGQGSAPNAAAAASVKHPVEQGNIQMLGVFVDTLIVCSCTAFIILLAQLPENAASLTGIQLTQAALESHVGSWGQYFLAVILFVFAFSTIIGNYAYAESNMQFLKDNSALLTVFRMLVLGFVYFGAVVKVDVVWNMGDLTMGVMAFINLITILLLSRYVFALVKDYQNQLKAGISEPVFKLANFDSKLKDKVKSDIW